MDRYLHLCDYALFDKDNKVSMIGVFDQVSTSKDFPFDYAGSVYAVASIETTPNTPTSFLLRLKQPKAEPIDLVKLDAKEPPTKEKSTVVLKLPPLPLHGEGRYEFEMLVNGKPQVSTYLDVSKI